MTNLRMDWIYIKMYKRFKPDIKLRFYNDFLVDINWKMSALAQSQVISFLCLFVIRRVNRLEPARLLRKLFPRPSFMHNTVNMERFILVDEPKAPQYKLVCWKIKEAIVSSWSESVWISKVTMWYTIAIHIIIYTHYRFQIYMNIKSNYVMYNCHSCSHLLTLSCLSVLVCSLSI
jgi:hypothetical protein